MKRLPSAILHEPKIRKGWISETDEQRAKLYRMEYFLIGSVVQTTTKRALLKQITEHACKAAGVTVPKLLFIDMKNRCYGCSDSVAGYIALNSNKIKSGCNTQVLLHELAHWITDHHYGYEMQDHGREFVTVYRWLLDKYKIIPGYCFDLLCEQNAVEVVDNYDAPTVFQF